jgi:hypothetical protein
MNKFNKRVNQILKEGILGGIAGATTAGVGSFLNAAKNPAQGIAGAYRDAQGIIKSRQEKTEKLKGTSFSNQNPPKLNSIIVTKAPILGTSKQENNPDYEPDILKRKPNAAPREIENANRQFLPTKVVTLIPNALVYAKVTKQLDPKNSTYGVALTDERGNPSQKYVFAQTEDSPFWQIYDTTKTPEDDVLVDEKGIPMKLTAIMTGPTKNDVSDPLKYWVDYKEYLNQNKGINKNI